MAGLIVGLCQWVLKRTQTSIIYLLCKHSNYSVPAGILMKPYQLTSCTIVACRPIVCGCIKDLKLLLLVTVLCSTLILQSFTNWPYLKESQYTLIPVSMYQRVHQRTPIMTAMNSQFLLETFENMARKFFIIHYLVKIQYHHCTEHAWPGCCIV